MSLEGLDFYRKIGTYIYWNIHIYIETYIYIYVPIYMIYIYNLYDLYIIYLSICVSNIPSVSCSLWQQPLFPHKLLSPQRFMRVEKRLVVESKGELVLCSWAPMSLRAERC